MTKKKRNIYWFIVTFFIVDVSAAFATSNHEYKKNEYVTISNGTSPDKKVSIKAHGEGDLGYDNFHLYLFDELSKKKIGPLTEIVDVLDTGADAFAAKWSDDSKTVTIIYRVDRHSPLKSMTYTLANGRALPKSKQPVDVTSKDLEDYWGKYGSGKPDGGK